MTGIVNLKEGWMNYTLTAPCYPKPKSIVHRNHNNMYTRHNNEYVPVFFNQSILEDKGQLMVKMSRDGEWRQA